MYRQAQYASVSHEVLDELRASLETAIQAGVPRESVILDPGLGFAKRSEHSFDALRSLPVFATLGCPLLAGPSRKSFLCAAIGERAPRDRDMATAASVAAAVPGCAYRSRPQRARHGRRRPRGDRIPAHHNAELATRFRVTRHDLVGHLDVSCRW
jgi:dihydropteroate synthase